ncbi:MAG: CHAP domain-containing protein [Spirochaetota bacterium]
MDSKNRVLPVAATCLVVLVSCAAGPGHRPADPAPLLAAGDAYHAPAPSRVRDAIVSGGLSLVDKETLVVKGVTYPADCTGLVRAAYAFADIDLAYRFSRYKGNGVRRIYLTLHDQGLLSATLYPAPGDIIFWDNTWDADGNKVADDELTHLGLVVATEPDGSISYLHYHYRLGHTVEAMNLLQPDIDLAQDGRQVNAALRMRGSPPGPGSNAAQLFRAFGKGYELSR